MKSFLVEQVVLTDKEIEQVRNTQTNHGYQILRDVIGARQAEALATHLDASLHDTEIAKSLAANAMADARRYSAALEVLDLLEEPGNPLYRIKLDQRR